MTPINEEKEMIAVPFIYMSKESFENEEEKFNVN
jgi:hypothetical protein